MRSYDSRSMLLLHSIRRQWLVRLLRTPGSHRDGAMARPKRLAVGHTCSTGLTNMRLTRTACCDRGQRATDLVMALDIARCERRGSAATLMVARLAMHEKAASYSVRIRLISTTLHDHPTLRIPTGNHFATALLQNNISRDLRYGSAMGPALLPKTLCCRRSPSAGGNDVVGQHWTRSMKLLASDQF